MTITIDLPPDEERRLLDRAARLGQDPTSYLRGLIRDDLDVEPGSTPRALDEALAPFRGQFQASEMNESELDDLVEELREEVWQEKHGRPSRT